MLTDGGSGLGGRLRAAFPRAAPLPDIWQAAEHLGAPAQAFRDAA